MSQAKAMKLREYGTDIISHELCYKNNCDNTHSNAPRVRNTDTFKSKVLESTPMDVSDRVLSGIRSAQQVHAKSRERLALEKPLTGKITRASYQDSNIFGYKDQNDATIQPPARVEPANLRQRNSGTYQSKAFDHLDGSYKGLDEATHHPSTTRKEDKWASSVFDGPIIEESTRKKLGRVDAG